MGVPLVAPPPEAFNSRPLFLLLKKTTIGQRCVCRVRSQYPEFIETGPDTRWQPGYRDPHISPAGSKSVHLVLRRAGVPALVQHRRPDGIIRGHSHHITINRSLFPDYFISG